MIFLSKHIAKILIAILSPDSADYRQPLIKAEYQKTQLQHFINHYYSSDAQGLSPWSQNLVQSLLPKVVPIEQAIIDDFDTLRPSLFLIGSAPLRTKSSTASRLFCLVA
jgi:hypothetical protein